MLAWRIILKHVIRKAVIIIAVILILVIALVAVVRSSRVPRLAFTDADLRPKRAQVTSQSNGFPLLLEAGKLLTVSEQDQIAFSSLGTGSSWDVAEARAFINSNNASLTAMRKAWSCPQLQVDAITNFAEEFPYLQEWRQLTYLALIEARISFHDGNEAEAFERAMNVVRFGHRVEESGGGTLHYLVGSAIKSQGLDCLRRFVGDTRLPADSLLSVSRQLRACHAL